MVLNQTGLPASTNPERGCTPPIGSPPAENTTTEGSSTRPRASIRSFSFFSFSRISVELRQSMCVCVDAFFYQGSVDDTDWTINYTYLISQSNKSQWTDNWAITQNVIWCGLASRASWGHDLDLALPGTESICSRLLLDVIGSADNEF